MPEKIQTRANHIRFDPVFHFVLLPVMLAIVIWAVVHVVRHPGTDAYVLLVLSAMVLLLTFKARTYALKVQDRVIRLEEQLRLATLAPHLGTRPVGLSEQQLVALRFASDSELPALSQRAAAEKLTPKQIKDAIKSWRPDYWRV